MQKYSVKLLFQFRVDINNCEAKMYTCEEKIILFHCKESEDIINIAENRGKKDEFNYINDDGNIVFYEFIGIVDMCHLGTETEEDEVWYDIKILLNPMERKNKLILTPDKLKSRIAPKL